MIAQSRRDKIIYWVATIWLSLGMVSTAIVQLMHMEEEVKKTSEFLGYPEYLLTLIGIAKILGVIVILIPGFPRAKEWAYAGFTFLMAGALYSHISTGDEPLSLFGPSLLLLLIFFSWRFLPPSRKFALARRDERGLSSEKF